MRKVLNIISALFLTFSLLVAGNVFVNVSEEKNNTSNSNFPEDPNVKAAAITYEMAPAPQIAYSDEGDVLATTTSIVSNDDMLKGFLAWRDTEIGQIRKVEILPDTYFNEDAQFEKRLNVAENGLIEGLLNIGGGLIVDGDARFKDKVTIDEGEVKINGVEYVFPDEQAQSDGYVLANNGEGELDWIAQDEIFPGISGTDNRVARFNAAGNDVEDGSINDLYASGVVLTIDASGNVSMTGDLDVAGDSDVDGNSLVGGNIDVAGNGDFDGTFNVDGAATFGGNVNVAGTANLTNLSIANVSVTSSAGEINFLDGASVAAGGMVFGNGTNFTQDVANIFWDDATNRLGIGTSAPAFSLDVIGGVQTSDDFYVNGIGLSDIGTTAAESGANLVWTFDEFQNSSGGSVQKVLNDLDASITTFSAGAGDIESVGSMTAGDVFADATADEDWLGLGAAAGRIEFDDQATDEVNIMSARVGIGTSAPESRLTVAGGVTIGSGFTGIGISAPLNGLLVQGNVGIGSTNPNAPLSVGANNQFNVNSSGNISRIGGVSHSIADSSGNLVLTSAGELIFDDSNISTTIQLSDVDATLPNSNTGIIDAINDAYNAAVGSAGGLWTLSTNVIHPTTTTQDFAIGGSTLAASIFSIDESSGTFLFGGDQSANPTLTFEATDSDTGDFGFNTNDSFYFSGANVGIGTTGPESRLTVTGGVSIGSGYTGIGISAPTQGLLVQGNVGIGATATRFALDVNGHIGPNINDTYDLGSDSFRFRDLYLGGDTLHIGTSTSDEYTIAYNTTANYLGLNVNGSGNPEITFDSDGDLGVGTTAPASRLEVAGTNVWRVNPSQGATGDIRAGSTISADGTNKTLNLIAAGSGGTAGASVIGAAFNGSAWRSMLEFSNVSSGEPNLTLAKSGGNVGIGTSNPESRLTVSGGATIGAGITGIGISAPTQGLLVQGNVGLGSTNPNAPLSIGATNQFNVNSSGNISRIGGGAHSIAASGSNLAITSAAELIFDDSNISTTIQLSDVDATLPNSNTGILDAINDAYNAAVGTSGGAWTLSSNVLHPTTATHDLAVGGSTLAASIFSIDESAGTFLFGGDQSANPTLTFEATDSDTADFGFNTADSFYFSGGNVGIGVTTPDQNLHVFKGNAGAVAANTNSIAVFENSTNGYLSIITPDASERGILFAEPSNSAAGGIIYNNTSNPDGIQFRTNGNNTRMVVDSAGNVGIATSSPTDVLHVSGAIFATAGFHVGADADANLIGISSTGSASTQLFIGNESILTSGDIGATVQAFDTELSAIAALAVTDGNIIVGNGTTWVAESGATARTSLGLGTIATQNSNLVTITGGSITGITDLAVADGGTGASTAAAARTNLELTSGATGDIWVDEAGDTMTGDLVIGGTTPTLTLGDDGAEDTALTFLGNAQDFHFGLDDTTDDLTFGLGTAVGTNPILVIENGGRVGLGTIAPTGILGITNTGTAATLVLTSNSVTTGQAMTLSTTGLTSGNALSITGSTTSGTTGDLVAITSDIGPEGAMAMLAPDFSGTAGNRYGLFVNGTDSTTSIANINYGVNSVLTLSNGGFTRFSYAVRGLATSSTTGSDNLVGVQGEAISTGAGSSSNTRNLTGVVGSASLTATPSLSALNLVGGDFSANAGTVGSGSGVSVYGLRTNTSGVLSTSGSVDLYGLYVDNGTASTTGTTAKYGIFIEDQTGADTNYGIKTEAAFNWGSSPNLANEATPDVSGGSYFGTAGATTTITGFDGGTSTLESGHIIYIKVESNVTFDVTATQLNGGTTDIVATNGDFLVWILEGGQWWLISFMDDSDNQNTNGADLAEYYVSSEKLTAGDVVKIDPNNDVKVVKSDEEYQSSVMGIVSTAPGIILGGPAKENTYMIALAGRVPTKVSTENGPIERGDYLTSSSIPGVAMKATKNGATVGKALEPYSGSGVGKIEVFVNTSWYSPNMASEESQLTLSIPQPSVLETALHDETDDLLVEIEAGVAEIQQELAAQDAKIMELTNRVTTLEGLGSSIALLTDRVDALTERLNIIDDAMEFARDTSGALASLIIKVPATFSEMAFFKAPIKVNADTSETVEIPAGTLKAKITFNKTFPETPTIYLNFVDTVPVEHKVIDVNEDGFTISFEEAPSSAIKIQWLAILREITEDKPSVEVIETEDGGAVAEDTEEIIEEPAEPIEPEEEDSSGISEPSEVPAIETEEESDSSGIMSASSSEDSNGIAIGGVSVIEAGEVSVEVQTSELNENSTISVTAEAGILLSTERTAEDKFSIKLDQPYLYDVSVNWEINSVD